MTAAEPIDLLAARTERKAAAMDDETLVEFMIGLLAPYGEAPMVGGHSRQSATITRTLFQEIAERWIPPDVYGEALRRFLIDADRQFPPIKGGKHG